MALVFLVAFFVQFGAWVWLFLRIHAWEAEREAGYLKLIRGLQNQLSAKDLAGYMALQNHDRKIDSPPSNGRPASYEDDRTPGLLMGTG